MLLVRASSRFAILTFCIAQILFGPLSLFAEEGQEISRLIETLASPNSEPYWPEGTDNCDPPHYPLQYDHEAQKRIFKAREELYSKGFTAVPLLVKHANDRRYSCTVNRGKWTNRDIGGVCRELVSNYVEVYQPFWHETLPTNISWFCDTPYRNNLGVRWQAHKNLCQREIQLKAVEWALKKQDGRVFVNEEHKRVVLDDLSRLRERIMTSDKPLRRDLDGRFLDEPILKPTKWRPPPGKKRGGGTDITNFE